MNLCSGSSATHRHEEVCYEGRDCPACEALDQLAESEQKVKSLETKVAELESQEAQG